MRIRHLPRVGALSGLLALPASQLSIAAVGSAAGTANHVYTYGDGRVLVTGLTFAGATCSNIAGFWDRQYSFAFVANSRGCTCCEGRRSATHRQRENR
jgi:hypothetical protein